MKGLLFVKAIHFHVIVTQKAENKSDEEWKFEHEQVCGFIRQFVDENIYNYIQYENHLKTVAKLANLYASKMRNNRLYLPRRMMQLKHKEKIFIAGHLNEFQGLINQLSGMGVKFEDEVVGLWLLAILLDS